MRTRVVLRHEMRVLMRARLVNIFTIKSSFLLTALRKNKSASYERPGRHLQKVLGPV